MRRELPPEWDRSLKGPSGRTYYVRAVRRGEGLRDPGAAPLIDLVSMITAFMIWAAGLVVRPLRLRRAQRRHGGFVVGVVRDSPWWIKVVRTEAVATDSEVAMKLDEYERLVESGEIV
jgi:hypothetical protein